MNKPVCSVYFSEIDEKPKIENQAGEGIRSLKTSGVFRAVNFELYARPNKHMMTFGICAFTFCVGYMIYMKESWRKEKVYTVINDKDELVMTKKKSRWD